MIKKNKAFLALILLLLVTISVCAVHFLTRTDVPKGKIKIQYNNKTYSINLKDVNLNIVEGVVLNGRGEEQLINAYGVPLLRLLQKLEIENYSEIKVVAHDEYSATVTNKEVLEENKVYLIESEKESMQLLIFGDPNSKRNVLNIAYLVVT